MRVSVEVEGIRQAIAEVDRLSRAQAQLVREAVGVSAINIQRHAKRRCPVDTGALRNSITVDFYLQGLTAEVGAHMPYAAHVEFGTRHQPAQPYLFPAWEQERPKFIQAIAEALKP